MIKKVEAKYNPVFCVTLPEKPHFWYSYSFTFMVYKKKKKNPVHVEKVTKAPAFHQFCSKVLTKNRYQVSLKHETQCPSNSTTLKTYPLFNRHHIWDAPSSLQYTVATLPKSHRHSADHSGPITLPIQRLPPYGFQSGKGKNAQRSTEFAETCLLSYPVMRLVRNVLERQKTNLQSTSTRFVLIQYPANATIRFTCRPIQPKDNAFSTYPFLCNHPLESTAHLVSLPGMRN